MLTEGEANYLARLPKEVLEKPVEIFTWGDYGDYGLKIAGIVMDEIRFTVPGLEIIFMGSMALGITGQKDIDLSILSPAEDFPIHRPKLEKQFGSPDKIANTAVGWHFMRDGYEVGIYLTDPVKSQVQIQLDVFNLLKNDSNLLNEYEELKIEAKGLPYREYQIRKYDFFHKILAD